MTTTLEPTTSNLNAVAPPDLDVLRARSANTLNLIAEQLQALRTYFGDVVGVPLDSSVGDLAEVHQQVLDVAFGKDLTIRRQAEREGDLRTEVAALQEQMELLRHEERRRADRDAIDEAKRVGAAARELAAWQAELRRTVGSAARYRAAAKRVEKALGE